MDIKANESLICSYSPCCCQIWVYHIDVIEMCYALVGIYMFHDVICCTVQCIMLYYIKWCASIKIDYANKITWQVLCEQKVAHTAFNRENKEKDSRNACRET